MRKITRSKSFVVLLVLFLGLSICAQSKKAPSGKKSKGKIAQVNVSAKTPIFPRPQGLLNDFANVLSASKERKIENVLRQLQKKAKIEFAVALIKSTGTNTMTVYSLEMAREWKIGSQNGGVLLLVAVNDRNWRFQIDRKLEESLTNEELMQIGGLMSEDFNRKDYAAGLEKCIEKVIALLAEKQNFEPITFQK